MSGTFGSKVKNLIPALLLVLITTSAQAESWTDNISFKGDFRYRHEMIDQEDKDQRSRHRMRARIGMYANVMEGVTFAFGITSGSDDPVSNNQTLGDGFSTKNVGIDFAYFDWKPDMISGLQVKGGKFKNPWYKPGKSELLWDSDWNPEGITANYFAHLDNIHPFVIASMLWVEEEKTDDDNLLIGGQGGLKFYFMEGKSHVTIGGSYFTYTDTKGTETFVDAGDSFGNSVDAAGLYANDYDIAEVFVELGMKINDVPVTIMGDYVTNSGVDEDNDGFLFGARFGKVKKAGAVSGRYIYREVKKDAVLGAYTDSDFIGGGSDGTGHEVGLDVGLAKKVTASASYFINQIGVEDGKDFNRLQLDVKFKF